MRKPTFREVIILSCVVIVCFAVLKSWDDILAFIGILLTAIIPLILGACIAYVIAIPSNFLTAHILPNAKSTTVQGLRKPLSLAITVLIVIVMLFLLTSTFIPALKETIIMVQINGRAFIEGLIGLPILEPVRSTVQDFLDGELVTAFESLDFAGVFKNVMGGSISLVGTQLFTVVSTVMTGFFGLLFSFVLLTDASGAVPKFMRIIEFYLGPKRSGKLRVVTKVADDTFHNFIVRQFLEAFILMVVGTTVLLIASYRYAVGVGALLGLAALIPIVGYPVGLLVGAFMVVITSPWAALAYVLAVAIAQMFEATFVLPHVGDPKTVLPPVWVTVGVTIGGGVAGFVGMLVAIPIASTFRQLVLLDYERRKKKKAQEFMAALEDGELQGAHVRVSELSERLEEDDGDGVR